ncbi:MAG: hypothetical protein ACEQSR_07210 [Candidatus Methylacidiphilales bacterium]
MLAIPFLLIQPIFIIWLFYKLIKSIVSDLKSNDSLFLKNNNWLLLLVATAVVAPLLGFSLHANENHQSTESWGGDDIFRLFAPKYLADVAIFYFTTVSTIIICSHFFKNQLYIELVRNGLLISLIILSIISSIQLGPNGLLLTAIPFIGFLLIAPIINILLFTAILMYYLKNTLNKYLSINTTLLLSVFIALVYIIIFQLVLSFFEHENYSLIKAFTESQNGFIPNLINN